MKTQERSINYTCLFVLIEADRESFRAGDFQAAHAAIPTGKERARPERAARKLLSTTDPRSATPFNAEEPLQIAAALPSSRGLTLSTSECESLETGGRADRKAFIFSSYPRISTTSVMG